MNFTVNDEQVDLLGEAIQISNLEQIQPGDQVSELFSVKSFSRKFREINFTKKLEMILLQISTITTLEGIFFSDFTLLLCTYC